MVDCFNCCGLLNYLIRVDKIKKILSTFQTSPWTHVSTFQYAVSLIYAYSMILILPKFGNKPGKNRQNTLVSDCTAPFALEFYTDATQDTAGTANTAVSRGKTISSKLVTVEVIAIYCFTSSFRILLGLSTNRLLIFNSKVKTELLVN